MWTPSSYLPRSAGPASSATCTEASPVPPGLQVLTDANLALPPFGTLGQNHQGKEQKEKESRRGEEGGGWKGSGKAQEGEQEGPITFFLTFGEITVLHMVVSELRLTWRRGLDLTTSAPLPRPLFLYLTTHPSWAQPSWNPLRSVQFRNIPFVCFTEEPFMSERHEEFSRPSRRAQRTEAQDI